MLPDDDVVRSSATEAPVLEGFRRLATFFAAPGRPLTARGNVKLADARQLIDLLETGGVYEHEIAGHVYSTQSSTVLRGVDHWVWWAEQAGVLRRRNNRLIGVKAWGPRAERDPAAVVRRAWAILCGFGVIESYLRLDWPVVRVLDEGVGPLLGKLVVQPDGKEYDELLAEWNQLIGDVGVSELFPGELTRHLDDMMTMLTRCGLVTQEGETRSPDRYGGSVRSGGRLWLTPIGVVLSVDTLHGEGVPVETDAGGVLTADELVDLAVREAVGPDQWWAHALMWARRQDADERRSLAGLLAKVRDEAALHLLMLLTTVPSRDEALVIRTLHDLAFDPEQPRSEAAGLALMWLAEHSDVDTADVDPAWMQCALVDQAALLGQDDPAYVVDLLAGLGDRDAQVEFVGLIAAADRPRSLELLDVVGRHAADKVVAKAARKEAMRLRSRSPQSS